MESGESKELRDRDSTVYKFWTISGGMMNWLLLGLMLVSVGAFADDDKPEAILKAKHHWFVIIDQMPKAHLNLEKAQLVGLLRDGYSDTDTKIHCHFSFQGGLRSGAESLKTSCAMGSDYKMATYPLICSDKQPSNDTWYEVYYKGKSAFNIEVHCR